MFRLGAREVQSIFYCRLSSNRAISPAGGHDRQWEFFSGCSCSGKVTMESLGSADAPVSSVTSFAQQSVLFSPPSTPISCLGGSSDTYGLRDASCLSMLAFSEAVTPSLTSPMLSPRSPANTYSFLGGDRMQMASKTLFPEVTHMWDFIRRGNAQHGWPPKRSKGVQAATRRCLNFLLLICACWLGFACVMRLMLHSSWLTALHQSFVFVLPILFCTPILLCFASAFWAWPRHVTGSSLPPPVISPRLQCSLQHDLEGAGFQYGACSQGGERVKHCPLAAAVRVTCAVVLLWCRHEAYLLVACLVGGFGVFSITAVDAVLSSVFGPSDVLVYSLWRSRRVGTAAAIVFFLVGSSVLTVGCLVGLLWQLIVAILSWFRRLVNR